MILYVIRNFIFDNLIDIYNFVESIFIRNICHQNPGHLHPGQRHKGVMYILVNSNPCQSSPCQFISVPIILHQKDYLIRILVNCDVCDS